MQGLSNVVPPQDPDQIPTAAQAAAATSLLPVTSLQQQPGISGRRDKVPGSAGAVTDQQHLKDLQTMQRYRTVFSKRGGGGRQGQESGDNTKKNTQVSVASSSSSSAGGQSSGAESAGGQSSGAESDPDFDSDYDKNFSENGSTSSLELDTSSIKVRALTTDLHVNVQCEH